VSVKPHTHAGAWCTGMLLLAAWLIGTPAAFATDASPLILEHLTTSDGLPQGTVFATLQDSQGFVWLATEDGLVRYDGHELYRYAYSRTARNGLPGNFINQVIEDRNHDLWVAVKDAGLARWNRASDTFTVYRHSAADESSLASDAVRALLIDGQGRVWIGTSDAGIDVLDPLSGAIEHLRHDPKDSSSLIDNQVQTLTLDRNGGLWIGTVHGLDRWQAEHHAFVHFRHDGADPHSLSSNQISQVLQDQRGTLWVGTFDGGLNRMDLDGHVLMTLRHDAHDPGSLSSDDVRAILEDQASHLWIGTAGGLDLLDRSSGQLSHYRHDASDPESLRDSFVMSLYEDQSGLVWIGTRAGGVSRWNPRSWELGGHRPAWLGDALVTAFADAPNNKVWIGSMGGGGLTLFDGESGKATKLDTILGRHNSIGDERVMSLRQDRRGNLWIGTRDHGVRELTTSGALASIGVKPGDPRSLSGAGIMTIVEARDGEIWFGIFQGGVNVLDPATGLIRQLPYGAGKPGAISAASVSAIAEDRYGYFWIGTDGGGLDLARADGTVIRNFRHDANDPATLPANTVYALSTDTEGRVWVATGGGGLALVEGSALSPSAIRFKVVSREEGLSSDTLYGVLSDANGRVWLSANTGLMRYDPLTASVKTYHREHGLQGEEFNFGAFYRLRDGRLCFGGPGGFNIFDPARLTENGRPPRLALTHVDVLGAAAPTARPYWLLDRLTLDYRASIVSLDFGALDFNSPKRNRIAYRMSGLTDRWIDLGSQHRITFTNLDAGDHVLEVRAANSDSVWSRTPLRLVIHREPAPWRSPWAFAAYVLMALALVAYRLRLQRLKFRRVNEERQRLESEVALRTGELLESNRRLEEALRAKSSFLDRMSHELRTPMNGVVGMTELLVRTPLSATQARVTQTIRSSARVLLQIVNDLLDLSKINAGKVALESLPLDLNEILEDCTGLFAAAAEDKGVELVACPPVSGSPTLQGDPLRLRQVLMNLIGNAVKFTAQGEIVVRAEVAPLGPDFADVELTVADTGIGMDGSTIGKIFEPFAQADESTTRRFGGSGLGLAICRELTELMGGSISVDSRPQVGSTFRVQLRLKLAESQPHNAVTLPPRRVRIRTRRPALAESLSRHVATLGLTVLGEERGHSAPIAREDLLLVDADSCPETLEPVNSDASAVRPPLVVIAGAAAAGDSARLVGEHVVVAKPVHRDALAKAICTALHIEPVASTRSVASDSTPVPAGGHVLLVEDEAVNAAVAEGYLTALGCTCVWVKSGTEAVARSAAERFDLIFMDLSMPGIDGLATASLIRQRESTGRRVPIIAVSARDARTYRDVCLAAGMDDMLSKPFTLEECAQLLRHWLHPVAKVKAAHPLSKVDMTAVARLRKLRTSGQSDLYSKLVDLFRTGSQQALLELRTALEREDLASAAAVAHRLTSSAANVGALAFATDARELERLCVAGDAPRACQVYERLEAVHPVLIEELLGLQLKESA